MPIVERECKKCGNVDEEIVPRSEMDLSGVCSHCGAETKRIISVCSFTIPGFKDGERITEDALLEGKVYR